MMLKQPPGRHYKFERLIVMCIVLSRSNISTVEAFAARERVPSKGPSTNPRTTLAHGRPWALRKHHAVSEPFDFASPTAWDEFYRNQHEQQPDPDQCTTEWHSSIPMDTLVPLIPNEASSVVMIGCGSSRLPDFIQERRSDLHLTLQDSSVSCMEMLQIRYGDSMSFACGDATKLSQCLLEATANPSNRTYEKYDIIYDKGLMDAIFCNEGWNGPISLLIREAASVLSDNGVYILVSYKLPKSTRDFLVEVGDANHLVWTFDCAGSNDRVGVSLARKNIHNHSA